MKNPAAQEVMLTIEDANAAQDGVHLSAAEVATLWDELRVLRGLRYRTYLANRDAEHHAPDWARAAAYIQGEQ